MNESCNDPNIPQNNHKDLDKTTTDFDAMIKIVYYNSMGFFFFMFIIPYITAQVFNETGTIMGWVFASQTIGGLISAPFVGYLTDRVSKKKLVLIGSWGRGAAYIIMYIAILQHSTLFFAAGIFFQGLTVGFFWTPFDTLVSQKSNKHHRSYAFGKRGAMIGKGNLVGTILSFSIFAVSSHFWPTQEFLIYCPLLLFCISNFYAGFIFNRNVKEDLIFQYPKEIQLNQEKNERDAAPNLNEDPQNQIQIQAQIQSKSSAQSTSHPQLDSHPHPLPSSIKTGMIFGFGLLILAIFISSMNESISRPFYQVYLSENIENNPILIMLIYFPSAILSFLISPVIGAYCDRMNIAIGISFISLLGAGVTFFLIQTSSAIVFSFLLLLDATLANAETLIVTNLFSRVSLSKRGKIFGVKTWFELLGSIMGPILGGYAWDLLGDQAPFQISIVIEILLIPIFLLTIKFIKPFLAEKLSQNRGK